MSYIDNVDNNDLVSEELMINFKQSVAKGIIKQLMLNNDPISEEYMIKLKQSVADGIIKILLSDIDDIDYTGLITEELINKLKQSVTDSIIPKLGLNFKERANFMCKQEHIVNEYAKELLCIDGPIKLSQLAKKYYTYIKEHNLFSPHNKRILLIDEPLRQMLNLTPEQMEYNNNATEIIPHLCINTRNFSIVMIRCLVQQL